MEGSAGSELPYYRQRSVEVLQRLKVRSDVGLTSQEVKKRRQEHGLNHIPRHKPRSPILVFLDRFKEALVLFLIGAGILSLILGEYADAIIIGVAVFLDATLSYVQVWRTQRTLDRLRQHVQHEATVLREGRLQKIPSKEVVVGDIIEFRAGQKIPADARLLKVNGLSIKESALTGEASDVKKTVVEQSSKTALGNRNNMAYMGTTVMSGSGRAVVTATGTATEFGRIAQQLKSEHKPRSPLHQKLQRSGIYIAWLVVVLVAIISVISFLQGATLAESSRVAITLIVSAVPEDLTIILTIALTVGVVRILRQKGVVRELSSGEGLGAATVICTDKTGTLTEGKMTATALDFLNGQRLDLTHPSQDSWHQLALTGLVLASDAHRVAPDRQEYLGSTTERTALKFAEDMGIIQTEMRQKWRQRDTIPFSTEWMYRANLHDHPTKRTQHIFVSGAPEIVLEKSFQALGEDGAPMDLTSETRQELRERINELGAQGNRLLAVAVRRHLEKGSITKRDVSGLLFLGVLLIRDPVRPEVAAAIHKTRLAGVEVKLVTGDFEETARAIAREVGLLKPDDEVIEGQLLQSLSDEELSNIVDDVVVFARVEPLDKQRIIRALQQKGHVVAMTGDGVNDAVALNSADIGIAMGSGKDIAKDAADLVLLDDNFATISAAIREGRVIRDNVRKVIAFLLSTNAAEVGIFLVSLILRLPLPLLPAQILWINLVTDGTSDIALSLEPEERNVMERNPENPKAALLNKAMVQQILLVGLVFTIFSMGLYWYLFKEQGEPLPYVQTMIFTFLALASVFSTWSYRSLWESMWQRGFWQNRWLFLSGAFSLSLQLIAIYFAPVRSFFGTVPLNVSDWLLLSVLIVVSILIIDLRKFFITDDKIISEAVTVKGAKNPSAGHSLV